MSLPSNEFWLNNVYRCRYCTPWDYKPISFDSIAGVDWHLWTRSNHSKTKEGIDAPDVKLEFGMFTLAALIV